jgi:hypothetical protein
MQQRNFVTLFLVFWNRQQIFLTTTLEPPQLLITPRSIRDLPMTVEFKKELLLLQSENSHLQQIYY